MQTIYDSNLRSIWNEEHNMSNGLDWKKISITDRRRAIFVCSICGNDYENFIDMEYDRMSRGVTPLCRHHNNTTSNNKRPNKLQLNRQLSKYGLIKDKHPELKPLYADTNEISWESALAIPSHIYRFICPNCGRIRGMSLSAQLSNRYSCVCAKRYAPFSIPEKIVFYMLSSRGVPIIPNDKRSLDGFELDMLIEGDRRYGIEYDGIKYHGGDRIGKDIRKYQMCVDRGIFLIRIVESGELVRGDTADRHIVVPPYRSSDKQIWDFIKGLTECASIVGLGSEDFTVMDYNRALDLAMKLKHDHLKSAMLRDNNEWLREWYDPEKNDNIMFDDIRVWDDRQYLWRCPKCGRPMISTPRSRIKNGCLRCSDERYRTKYAIFQYDLDGKYERCWDSDVECSRFFGTTPSSARMVCMGQRKRFRGNHTLRYAVEVGWRVTAIEPVVINDPSTKTFAEKWPELVEYVNSELNGGFDPAKDTANASDELIWSVDRTIFKQRITYRRKNRKPLPKNVIFPVREIKQRQHKNHTMCSDTEQIKFWDFGSNVGLDPTVTTSKSSRTLVHWKCPICGAKFITTPGSFWHRKIKCPECRRMDVAKRRRDSTALRLKREENVKNAAISHIKSEIGNIATLLEFKKLRPDLYKIAKRYHIIKHLHLSQYNPRLIEPKKKPVLKLSKDGRVLERFASMNDARRATGLNSLPQVLTHRQSTAGGFRWMYEKEYMANKTTELK